MKVKICGITEEYEIEYLNMAQADYAGFVFYEPSKRNLTIERAGELMTLLSEKTKKVAVCVSPDASLVKDIQTLPVDVIQIHKKLSEDVLSLCDRPVWYAVNIEDDEEIATAEELIASFSDENAKKIEAIVVDAKNFGSGRPFNWRKSRRLMKAGAQSPPLFENRLFVLAGGLKPDNVREGIEIFSPDIVDVSSGVEGPNGKKDESLINNFVKAFNQEQGKGTKL